MFLATYLLACCKHVMMVLLQADLRKQKFGHEYYLALRGLM